MKSSALVKQTSTYWGEETRPSASDYRLSLFHGFCIVCRVISQAGFNFFSAFTLVRRVRAVGVKGRGETDRIRAHPRIMMDANTSDLRGDPLSGDKSLLEVPKLGMAIYHACHHVR